MTQRARTTGDLTIRNARVVTPDPAPFPLRGQAMAALRISPTADVRIVAGRIVSVGPHAPADGPSLDAAGRVLLPGLIDCHTHLCWAGDRLDEWERKLRGESYLEILKAGGGIMSTVRAVRAATEQELTAGVRARLDDALRQGVTTIEIKSGYGLDAATELKMLRAIRAAAEGWAGTVVMTALLGHAVEVSQTPAAWFEHTIRETLPHVSREFPGISVDAFCESGAWTFDAAVALLRRARELGHPVRVHADQFSVLGMTEAAAALGARSVDHLEASTPEGLAALARSEAVGVGLPICGLHMLGRRGAGGMFADLRALVDAGGAAAVATNTNPGSAPSSSMALALGMAVRACGLSPAEAITAGTRNAAAVLGLEDRGAIAPGLVADLLLLRARDERELTYALGAGESLVDAVIVGGVVMSRCTMTT